QSQQRPFCQTCGSEDVSKAGDSLVCTACGAVLADSSQRLETFSQSLVSALVSGARLKAVASAANVRYSASQPLAPLQQQQPQHPLHPSHSQPLFQLGQSQLQPLKTSISETIRQPLTLLPRPRDSVILSSQANALIQLGAAPASQFRSGLFRLWYLYLSRTNEAFLTEAQRPSSQNKKPAKGWGGLIVPEPGGGGVGRGRTVRQKRARPDKITEADLADTLAQLSAAGGELCDLGLAREDSDDSDADFYTSISDDADDDELDDDAHSITSQSVARSLRRLLRHDESSKSRGQPSSEQPPPPGLRSTFRARQLASAGRPLLRTRLAGQKLNETNLALLYITCQLEASVASPIVCLSHLLHLVAVGQVPYFDSLRRLPERYCVTEPGVAAMLRRSSAPRYDTLVEIVARLSSLLSIRVFPRHRFLTICAYVIDRMRLPDQLTEFVSRLATRLLGNYSARHPLSNQD
uniref:TFIIB-type domain-containing protein n=1 Tax=Macrostomum lignano TaxID=282301 RepID=A0A1I8HZX4_9PLAT